MSNPTCFVCDRDSNNVPQMVQIDDNKFICNECTDELSNAFKQSTAPSEVHSPSVLKPKAIKHILDESVIGQEEAKKVLSVEIYNHYKRINNLDKDIQKSNILLIGDSGTGKTLLVQTLSKLLDIPMVIADMSLVTAAGYVGQDIESTLQQLVIAADGDIKKAQTGIILIDEVDKIAKRNLTSSTEKDPSGEGVQQGLLKILEGTQVLLKGDGIKPSKTGNYIDTTNILFIGAGAFFGLDKVIEKNHSADNQGIGFSATVEKPDIKAKEITEQDIIEYGFIPEFVGRLPVIVQLQKLTKADYRRILTEPKNSITHQYQKLLAIDDYNLEFTPEYLDSVVEKVFSTSRGARALRTEIEKTMRDIIFSMDYDAQDKTIVV